MSGQTSRDKRLDGRTCVITGATSGIGRAAALELAKLGANVVIVGRSPSRLGKTEGEVARAANGGRVTGILADLSAMASVRSLARDLIAAAPEIHVLINNAGVFTRRRDETIDGLETQLAVNHLAPFLLTNLLVEHLARSAPARVVTVASQVERSGAIDFADLQGRRDYDGLKAYRQSKLANILFTRELARRTAGRGITAVSLHPGVYTTHLLDAYNGWSTLVTRFRDRGLPRPEAGGPVLVHAATVDLHGQSGVHLHERELREPSPQAQDDETARRLWEVSADLVGLDR